jgi:hypothetical protein
MANPQIDRFDAGKLRNPPWDAMVPVLDTPYTKGIARELWVGTAGNVSLVTGGGTVITYVGVAAGTLLRIFHTQVSSSGTSAGNLVAHF